MDTKFEFDPKAHVYTLDTGDGKGARPMQGVTSVLGIISKPALIGWAAKMAVEYIRETAPETIVKAEHGELGVLDIPCYGVTEKILDEAAKAYATKRDKAGAQGTSTHADIEGYVKDCIENGGKATFDYREFEENGDGTALYAFMTWATENEVTHWMPLPKHPNA